MSIGELLQLVQWIMCKEKIEVPNKPTASVAEMHEKLTADMKLSDGETFDALVIPMIRRALPPMLTGKTMFNSGGSFGVSSRGNQQKELYKVLSRNKYNSTVEALRMNVHALEFNSDPTNKTKENQIKKAQLISTLKESTSKAYHGRYDNNALNIVLSHASFETSHGIFSSSNIKDIGNYSGPEKVEVVNHTEGSEDEESKEKCIYTMYVNFNLGIYKTIRIYGDCLFEIFDIFMDIIYEKERKED